MTLIFGLEARGIEREFLRAGYRPQKLPFLSISL